MSMWTSLCLVLALFAGSWPQASSFLHAPAPCPNFWAPIPDSQHGQPRHQCSSLWRLALRMRGTARRQQGVADSSASSHATTGHDMVSGGPEEQVVTRGERKRGRGGGGGGVGGCGGGGGRDRDGGGGGGGSQNKVHSNALSSTSVLSFRNAPACSQFRVQF